MDFHCHASSTFREELMDFALFYYFVYIRIGQSWDE